MRVILATGPLLSSRCFLSLLLALSFSFLPIARRDDTLPAGDKGSRARGRAKLEMLIPGMAARRAGDGRGEAGVSYETVLILSFIPARRSLGSGEERCGYHRRRDGCDDVAVAAAVAAVATGCMRPVSAGCAIRSVNARRKKRLSRDHGVKLLFARHWPSPDRLQD